MNETITIRPPAPLKAPHPVADAGYGFARVFQNAAHHSSFATHGAEKKVTRNTAKIRLAENSAIRWDHGGINE